MVKIDLNVTKDDGNKMRGHRLNLFSNRFKYVGIGVGHHKKFKFCCVVNFAVEYEEKDEDDEVFFDKLPDIGMDEPGEGEYYQDELDEMAEWKGPGGIPHFNGASHKQNLKVFKKASNHIRPHKPMENNFGNRNEIKSNAFSTKNNFQKKTTNQNKRNHVPHKGPHKAKCKVFSVPLGGLDDDDKVSEEIIHLKRKNTIEDYSSEKELNMGIPLNNQENEEEEEFEEMLGGGMHFQKKKQQSNNMYMKQGINRNKYMKEHNVKPQKETLKKSSNLPPRQNIMKKAAPIKVNSRSPKPHRPYMIPKKSGGYNSSKSPRMNKYKNTNMYSPSNSNKNQPQKKSSNSSNSLNNVDDKRSKQLLEMDDFSMPFEAMNCMTKRIVKIQGGNRVKTVRKIFTMRDGTQEIHENVYVERIQDKK